jgi:polysaccharide chain length determinant protein (PEP-CTERM system associated)
MDNAFSPQDIIAALRRRWLLIAIPLAIGVPLSVAVAMLLPSTYTSTARILVLSQQIPSDLARSTVAQSSAERIALTQQRLLTRQNLLEIAQQYNVFRGRGDLSPSDIVTQMRGSTVIAGTNPRLARRTGSNATSIDIAFRASDPQLAARVANEFVNRVLAENVQARTDRASGTVAFFDEEVQRLTQEIDTIAARIVQYKQANQNALPTNLGSRQDELKTLRDRAFAREGQRRTLEEQRRTLQQALEVGATVITGDGQRTAGEAELGRLRAQLVQQRATLAESHPTIRQLTARIAALEASIATPASAPGATPAVEGGAGTSGQAATTLAQIERVEQQLTELDRQAEVEDARAAELERSIAATPAVELGLGNLERAYATLQVQFREATVKQSQAQIGERLEATQQAERFEVLEQAIPPETPSSPNRPRIIAAGTALSLALGLAMAALVELLNRVVRTARDIERHFGLHPIVTIPYIASRREESRRRWRTRLVLIGLVALVPTALIVVDTYVTPLQLLLDQAMERLQLRTLMGAVGLG